MKKQIVLNSDVHQDALSKLELVLSQVNDKEYGRKLRDCDVVAFGLKLLDMRDMVKMQDLSMSKHDIIDRVYDSFPPDKHQSLALVRSLARALETRA